MNMNAKLVILIFQIIIFMFLIFLFFFSGYKKILFETFKVF